MGFIAGGTLAVLLFSLIVVRADNTARRVKSRWPR